MDEDELVSELIDRVERQGYDRKDLALVMGPNASEALEAAVRAKYVMVECEPAQVSSFMGLPVHVLAGLGWNCVVMERGFAEEVVREMGRLSN